MESTLVEGIKDSLEDIVPESVQDFLSSCDLRDVSFDSVYQTIVDTVKGSLSVPIGLVTSLGVCILLTALMQSFSEVAKAQRVYSMVSVLVCMRVVVQPIVEAVSTLKEVMVSSAMFIDSYVPILSGIMVANGQVSTSASYGAITYVSCQLWVQFANNLILPLMSVSLAMSCVGGVCSELSFGEVVRLIKRVVRWVMSVSMFIFSGLVTVQSTVCNSSDKVTAKALKFVVSNGVPIVGNAISDACETVRSSLGLLKSTVGIVGIVALLVSVLPSIVNVGILRAIVTMGETLASTFDVKCIQSFLRDVSEVLSAVFSCAICFAVTFIVSIGAIVLLVSY